MRLAAWMLVITSASAQADPDLTARCDHLAEDVSGARPPRLCVAYGDVSLERFGLAALEVDEARLYVGAGGRVLAPLSRIDRDDYRTARDVSIHVAERSAGKLAVLWIVTTTTVASSVPDGPPLGEARYLEELTLCIVDDHPRCPLAAVPLREGSYAGSEVDAATAMRRARSAAVGRARVTLGPGKAVIAPATARDRDDVCGASCVRPL